MYADKEETLRLTLLGTGTSTGVPEVGCTCPVCTSEDPHDKRTRCSALLETGGERILIDCGPDFRQQVLPLPFKPIHAVLLTHEHYDHVGGIDDIRPFCRFGDIPFYAEANVADRIRRRIPYCFIENRYPGVPQISLHEVSAFQPFFVGKTEVVPFRVMHGNLPILGYRIGPVAYITDMLTLPPESYEVLKGVKCLVMNALRVEEHYSHQTLSQALENVRILKPERCFLIHMSHAVGFHAEVDRQLPPNVHLAYDGLQVQI